MRSPPPLPLSGRVKVPTLMAHLRQDSLIHGEKNVRAILDAPLAEEKELLWIEESSQRVHAYKHFGQHPGQRPRWFGLHMSRLPAQP
jgi:uncharacterized protein